MFASVVAFLERNLAARSDVEGEPAAATRLAIAALCMEMVRADYREHPQELARARDVLAERFALGPEEAEALLKAGASQSDQAVSLYRFTRPLNEALDQPGKLALIEMLWKVALEDGQLDKYEDALMHKLADLLYVPIGDLMRLKQRVLEDA